MEIFLPSETLSPFVRRYRILETFDGSVNRVFPDTALVMAFRFNGQVRNVTNGVQNLPPFILSGLRKSVRLFNYSKNSGNILVEFREGGASAFIKEPLNDLFDTTISLDNFRGYKTLDVIEESLAKAATPVQKINLIEGFLLSKLMNPKPDKVTLLALEKIQLAKGVVQIKKLADSLCTSQDAFEKRFRRNVGISPKQFAYIIRMKSVIKNGLGKQPFTQTALDAGYYDQAHFNKDFKLFTGQCPTEFLKSPRFW